MNDANGRWFKEQALEELMETQRKYREEMPRLQDRYDTLKDEMSNVSQALKVALEGMMKLEKGHTRLEAGHSASVANHDELVQEIRTSEAASAALWERAWTPIYHAVLTAGAAAFFSWLFLALR